MRYLKLLSIACLATAFPWIASAQSYNFSSLTSGTGNQTYAYGINDSGLIVGSSLSVGKFTPIYYTTSAYYNALGRTAGDQGEAYAVGDTGVIAGYGIGASGNSRSVYYATPSTYPAVIPEVASGLTGYFDAANAVSSNGTYVAGSATYDNFGDNSAYVYDISTNAVTNLGVILGGLASGTNGVNSSGEAVGFALDSNNGFNGFYAKSGGSMTQLMDLSTVTGNTEANAINDLGTIVGFSDISSGAEVGVYWDSSQQIHQLGVLSGYNQFDATAISQNGDYIAGNAFNSSGQSVAILWKNGAGPVDLSAELGSSISGWQLSTITGVNNSGVLVGYGQDGTAGLTQGFEISPQAVPEPSALAFGGLLSLFILTEKRNRLV